MRGLRLTLINFGQPLRSGVDDNTPQSKFEGYSSTAAV